MSSNNNLPIILKGKRATIAGRTGSGKSTLACWLLSRSPLHWIVLNPKWTKAYADLPDAVTIDGIKIDKINRAIEDHRYTIVNPQGIENNWEYLDNVIQYYHESRENLGLCADELYTLHNNGRAGPGLIGWLTRGRELGQSFLGMTQRPAWVSQFVFSEADYIAEMDLTLLKDRKAIYDATGQEYMLHRLPPRKWYWYDVSKDTIAKYGAVPLLTRS